MSYKGMKEKAVISWMGALKLERGYYYCDGCRSGLCPLDQQLELWQNDSSPTLNAKVDYFDKLMLCGLLSITRPQTEMLPSFLFR